MNRQSSSSERVPFVLFVAAQYAPKAFASRMSFQLSAGSGGRQRLSPTGGAP
jgi:hypothetical protein